MIKVVDIANNAEPYGATFFTNPLDAGNIPKSWERLTLVDHLFFQLPNPFIQMFDLLHDDL